MVEVSFCSVRWYYLCRQRDCHGPWAVIWSFARLQSVHQKGILNISPASGRLDASSHHSWFVLFFFFLSLSILSDFQTHCKVLRSKAAVNSFSTDKLDWLEEGCTSGERRIQFWSTVMSRKAMGNSSRIFPTWLKGDLFRSVLKASSLRGPGLLPQCCTGRGQKVQSLGWFFTLDLWDQLGFLGWTDAVFLVCSVSIARHK